MTIWQSRLGISSLALDQRLIRLTKTAALISALWTVFCAALLFGWQAVVWLKQGVWRSYTVASLIRGDPEVTYTTASYDSNQLLEDFLELPAIIPLLVAAILLLAFQSWMASIQKSFHEDREGSG
jgi:hypothetical protein